ncbi:MAG: carbon-nitrogen hydrolase family protein, partial [Thermoanaerobaculia bacterium]|nr:carbon-nitrogen hydrolase family protein [Thermoanaerobaculia bacterium]
MERFIAAAVQMNSTPERERNLEQAFELIDEAAARGARFIATPENTELLAPHGVKVEAAEPLSGATIGLFSDRAKQHGVWLLVGSFGERSPDSNRVRNTSVLISPKGDVHSVYRKIHLFDVDLDDGTSVRESSQVEPGDEAVVADTPLARFGMSVCYDLRFPELYRELAHLQAEVILIPSAFTLHTGKDHWEILVRARAIENSSWVIAPAQTGHHLKGRTSYGHSMIVDPWG